jgi:dihydroorotate dehydrogenase
MVKYYALLKPLLLRVPEETAHLMAIDALRYRMLPTVKLHDPRLSMTLGGLNFPNPIGMAAGFDKDAEVIGGLFSQGFGFVETGTVTPKAQAGNDKPRLFRLKADEAIINRMGFNNKGLKHYAKQLEKWKRRKPKGFQGILGANIGRNKESPNDASDYLTMLDGIYGLSDYITINISSPNTPGLREMQKDTFLDGFLGQIMARRGELAAQKGLVPIFLKIAPDVSRAELESIGSAALKHGLDALIIGNTSVGLRERLQDKKRAEESGGLSGRPLMDLSTSVLAIMYRFTKGKLPLIGVGGISSAEDAYRKIGSGASLIQIYSALIYQGFSTAKDIHDGLGALLERDGLTHLKDAVGKDVKL